MKTLILLFVIISQIALSLQVTNLYMVLEPQEESCLHEYFSDKTLIIYELFFNNTQSHVVIKDPESKIMTDKEANGQFKEAFTTFQGGYYEICITNKDREVFSEVHFQLKHGVAAKDYSAVAKSKDLKPLELDLIKLDDKSKELHHYISFSAAHEEIFESILDGLSSKISFFSFILISVMIVIGLLETLYLRQYLMNRKNI